MRLESTFTEDRLEHVRCKSCTNARQSRIGMSWTQRSSRSIVFSWVAAQSGPERRRGLICSGRAAN